MPNRLLLLSAGRRLDRVAYAAEVLRDSPAGLWLLNESAGTTATDSSGNALNGTYNATGISYAQAGPGRQTAAAFDGAAGLVTVADAPSLNPAGSFTVEVWARRAAGVGFGRIVFKGSFTSWQIRLSGDGVTAEGGFVDSTNADALVPIGALALNTWHHCAVVFNGATITPYLDGAAGTPAANTNGPRASTQPLGIGHDGVGTTNLWNGRLFGVAFFNSALSQQRLQAHRNAALRGVA